LHRRASSAAIARRARRERRKLAMKKSIRSVYGDERGAAGYILAWLLGVPASLLFVIFLLRGCN
jgi:hypothetical protein